MMLLNYFQRTSHSPVSTKLDVAYPVLMAKAKITASKTRAPSHCIVQVLLCSLLDENQLVKRAVRSFATKFRSCRELNGSVVAACMPS